MLVVSTLCWRLLSMIHPRVFTFPCLIKGSQRQWSLIIAHPVSQPSACLKYVLALFSSVSLFLPSLDRKSLDEIAAKHAEMLYWVFTSLSTVQFMLYLIERDREAFFAISVVISDVYMMFSEWVIVFPSSDLAQWVCCTSALFARKNPLGPRHASKANQHCIIEMEQQ